MKSNAFQLSDEIKKYTSKQVIPRTNSLEKKVFTVGTFKVLWVVLFRQIKERMVYFGLFESPKHF